MDEDGLEVLMVGQLWCWIINEGEARMCLFFPILQPREISFAVGSIVLSRIMICFDGHANGPASEIEWVGQYSLSCGYGRHLLPSKSGEETYKLRCRRRHAMYIWSIRSGRGWATGPREPHVCIPQAPIKDGLQPRRSQG